MPILYNTVGLPLAALLALVFAGALLDAPGQTAREAMLPELLDRAEMTLERGTSLFDGVSRGANMLGAPLAGVLIAVVGPTQRARARCGDVRGVGVADVRLRPGERAAAAESDAEGYFAQLREGYRFLWHTPLVRAIVIMVLVTNTLDAGMGGVLMPVYADQVLDSVVALGLMAGAMGLTAFAGTLVFAWIGHRAPRLATLVIGFTLGGPFRFFLLAAMPGIGPAVIGFAIAGIGIGPINPILGTLGYERVPPELRARVFGALSAGVMAGRADRRPAGGGVRRARRPPGDADRLRRRLPRLHPEPARRAGVARPGAGVRSRPSSARCERRAGVCRGAAPRTRGRTRPRGRRPPPA